MPPTGPRRRERQEARRRFALAREDAQLLGLIPTTPEGSLRDERVDPRSQSDDPRLSVVREAVRNNWATPDEKKGAIVDQIVRLVEAEDTDPRLRVQAARTLQQMDRDQWERDNPELAGKVKGGVSITNQQQVVTGDQAIRLLQQIEQQTGERIMSEAMLEIEDAGEVIPPEVT